jgi:hypothetical protein
MSKRRGLAGVIGVTGSSKHPAIGAAASAAVGTLTAVGVQRYWPEKAQYSELMGGAAGIGTGLLLMIAPSLRAAGFTGALVSLLNHGIRELFARLSPAAGATAGAFGIPNAQVVPGFGAVAANRVPLMGSGQGGLGVVSSEVIRTLSAGAQPGSGGVQILGGGLDGGLTSHYGASMIAR